MANIRTWLSKYSLAIPTTMAFDGIKQKGKGFTVKKAEPSRYKTAIPI
jgi:hypothetical protein